MDKNLRAAIQRADRYARNKAYLCLVPGCTKPAILSHAIQRASIVEALTDNGVVYTQRQSFNPVMTMDSPAAPVDVVEVGVNEASVFRGFCAGHDLALFAAAEKTPLKKWMYFPLHLRALSFEYCRRRRTADFFRKVSELMHGVEAGQVYGRLAEKWETLNALFRHQYIGSIFAGVDKVEYVWIPFIRNLQLACCGCFQQAETFDSVVAYNVISFANTSFVVFTIFKVVERYLDAFLANYNLPSEAERLVNELAFSKGEEPLIAPRLWRALSDDQKLEVRLSLRHPSLRVGTITPQIVKVTPDDLVTEFTPPLLRRFSSVVEGSLEEADETIRSNPDGVSGFINRAKMRAASGDQAGALEDYGEVIRLQPEDATTFICRATIRHKNGDIEGALADYDEAVRLDPTNARAFSDRGFARRTMGDIVGSLADFSRVIDLQPTVADAYLNRGAVRGVTGDVEGALDDCNEAIRLDSNSAAAFMNRGNARRIKGEIEGALEDYDRAIALNRDYAEVFISRSTLRAAKRDFEGAKADIMEAARLDPQRVAVFRNRLLSGEKRRNQGQGDESAEG
jgi:tetratricopeptide (TPR) repeat protein